MLLLKRTESTTVLWEMNSYTFYCEIKLFVTVKVMHG